MRLRQVTLLAAFLAFSLSARAAQPSTDINLCPEWPIRFAHYEFGLMYSAGYGGIDDDIQKEIALRSGCNFVVTTRPRARIWSDLERGALDMAGSGIQTAERDRFAWFSHYIVEDNVVVLGPKVPKTTRSFAQFVENPALTLGGVRSYRYSPFYDKNVDKLIASKRHIEAPDPGALYRMFDVQRFDAFITSPILYLHYVKQLALPAPVRIEDWDPAGGTPSGLVLSKRTFTSAQAAQWNALIQKMLVDGTVSKIVEKHMGAAIGAKSVYRGTE